MYSRVTLLELDTLRLDMDEAVELYKTEVLPHLRAQEGFEGVIVLVTPEGKGMLVSFWDTEEGAHDASGFASGQLERYTTLFRAPPGRDQYVVAYAEPPQTVLAA